MANELMKVGETQPSYFLRRYDYGIHQERGRQGEEVCF